MAGVKGRSGGARENAGGAREGSGPKPRPTKRIRVAKTADPVEFLLNVMNNQNVDAELRVKAAEKAARLTSSPGASGGKKGDQKRAAESAASGRFAPAAPPKLSVVGK